MSDTESHTVLVAFNGIVCGTGLMKTINEVCESVLYCPSLRLTQSICDSKIFLSL